jgi:hypothetical protein
MRILAIISGEYGQRHVDNIRAHGPSDWQIEVWQAPAVLPPIVDYPEDHLPDRLPASDLILSFAELKGVAELLPDIARMTGAKAVIVAVDNEAWLPRGLARQLRRWLGDIGQRSGAMPSVAARVTSRKGWWASRWMRRSKRQGCCTITTHAWPAWARTRPMGIR